MVPMTTPITGANRAPVIPASPVIPANPVIPAAPTSAGAPAAPAAGATAPATSKTDLDKDAFLKLLVAQLKYQDPMNPAQGTEFVAQTAQFTTVEKLTDLAEVQDKMLTAQLTLGAASMLGRSVSYNDAAGKTTTGTVTGATLGTSPTLTINGLAIPFGNVTTIGQAGLATTTGPNEPSMTPVPGIHPVGPSAPPATTPTGAPVGGVPAGGAPATGAPVAAPPATAPAAGNGATSPP
jgi:flagellar basal-body rod modification protein FlgD